MSAFTGTLRLVRLALRRDRMQLPIWLGGMAAGLMASATTMSATYPTIADRVAAAKLLATNPATLVLRGAAANTSTGALIMNDALWILAVLAALMSIFAVVRHTRQKEETGRAELVGAAPVGRHASLAAALTVTVGANVAPAVLLALVLIALSVLALAGYIGYGSFTDLLAQEKPGTSIIGIVLNIVALTVMVPAAIAQRRTGKALRNEVLVAQSQETWISNYLSVSLRFGLGGNALFGWWWADPAVAVLVAGIAAHSGATAWREARERED